MSRKEVAAVHVWWQDDSDDGPEWVVSTVDDDGDEVTCIGGYGSDLGDAWERACAEADARGVPALELDRVNGTERDRYEPRRTVSRTEDAWWAWHDADESRYSPGEDSDAATAEAERRCAAWVAGESDDGPSAETK